MNTVYTSTRTYFQSRVDGDVHIVSAFQKTFGLQHHHYHTAHHHHYSINNNNNNNHDGSGMNDNNNNRTHYNKMTIISNSSSSNNNDDEDHGEKKKLKNYTIGNRFIHWVMLLGAALGNESMFASFLPFLYWNVSWSLGRHVIVVWFFSEYVGQVVKDLMCLPRPKSPPVIRLESHYETEYGLPSTHAMAAVSMSNYLFYYMMQRYRLIESLMMTNSEISSSGSSGIVDGEQAIMTRAQSVMWLLLGYVLVVLWCFLTCLSRLYLGVHSLIDIYVGLLLGYVCVMAEMQLYPIVDLYVMQHGNFHVPIVIVCCFVFMLAVYPRNRQIWSSSFGDTARVLGVSCGCFLADWLHSGLIAGDLSPFGQHDHAISSGALAWIKMMLLRCLVGYSTMFISKGITKKLTYLVVPRIIETLRLGKAHVDGVQNCHRYIVEVPCVFMTYAHIGFAAVFTGPMVMRALGIPI